MHVMELEKSAKHLNFFFFFLQIAFHFLIIYEMYFERDAKHESISVVNGKKICIFNVEYYTYS